MAPESTDRTEQRPDSDQVVPKKLPKGVVLGPDGKP